MVRSSLVLLVALPFALATGSLRGFQSLNKRQQLSGDATQQVEGLLTLAQQVLTDAQNGNITTACTTWSGSLVQCEGSAGQNRVQLASCACSSTILDQLDSCASSYGSTGTSAASGFKSFCSNTLPSIAQAGTTSFVGASSATSGGISSQVSATASSVSSAISSSASSILSAASSVASIASASSSSAQSSAPSAGSNGTSGASKSSVVAGSIGIITLMAAFLV